MAPPFTFDPSGQREDANALLQAGVTQAQLAAREVAARGDVSQDCVLIGNPAETSANPMALGNPLGNAQQPGANNPAVPTTTAPAPHLDALNPNVTTPYIQPNNFTPAPRSGTTPTVKNPMGL